jgi:hypothetical protein
VNGSKTLHRPPCDKSKNWYKNASATIGFHMSVFTQFQKLSRKGGLDIKKMGACVH